MSIESLNYSLKCILLCFFSTHCLPLCQLSNHSLLSILIDSIEEDELVENETQGPIALTEDNEKNCVLM